MADQSLRTTECKESKQCHPAKHHYDECVERVTSQEQNEGGAKEDCVEECKLGFPPSAIFSGRRPTILASRTKC